MQMILNIGLSVILILSTAVACTKAKPAGGGNNNQNPPNPTTDSIYNPIDPALAGSIGFFQNDWKQKSFTAPDVQAGTVPTGVVTDSLTINVNKVITKVPVD